jgi:hypothetical protein
MTIRNKLSDALAKLVCRLRGRHVMGAKYQHIVWFQSCVICDYTVTCDAPRKRVKGDGQSTAKKEA